MCLVREHVEKRQPGRPGLDGSVKVKVKFTPEQATKAQKGSRIIALLFL
jgi:hypothetical protein